MIDAKLFQNWTKQTTKLGFALAFMLFSLAISAQVKGVITDAGTGEPLIGASVLVKGTTDVYKRQQLYRSKESSSRIQR